LSSKQQKLKTHQQTFLGPQNTKNLKSGNIMIQPQYFPKIENNKFKFKNKNKVEAIIRYLGPETYKRLNGQESALEI
jgi:hypothetical protein